jgi:hypothetical protein
MPAPKKYPDELRERASQFGRLLPRRQLDGSLYQHAERRSAVWLHQYCTGELPPREPELRGARYETRARGALVGERGATVGRLG